jgi:hypothetical protein
MYRFLSRPGLISLLSFLRKPLILVNWTRESKRTVLRSNDVREMQLVAWEA